MSKTLKAFRRPDDSRGMTVTSTHKSSTPTRSGLRRWSRPHALAVLAITAGSLGLSTSAFATTSSSGESTTNRVSTAPELAAASYLESYAIPAMAAGPVIVLVSDTGQNIVELTPSGALVVLVRVIRIEPIVRRSFVVEKPKVVPHAVLTSVTTTKPCKTDKARRPLVLNVGWWAGDPSASWHALEHFCDGQKGRWQPQSYSARSWYGRSGGRWNH